MAITERPAKALVTPSLSGERGGGGGEAEDVRVVCIDAGAFSE